MGAEYFLGFAWNKLVNYSIYLIGKVNRLLVFICKMLFALAENWDQMIIKLAMAMYAEFLQHKFIGRFTTGSCINKMSCWRKSGFSFFSLRSFNERLILKRNLKTLNASTRKNNEHNLFAREKGKKNNKLFDRYKVIDKVYLHKFIHQNFSTNFCCFMISCCLSELRKKRKTKNQHFPLSRKTETVDKERPINCNHCTTCN